jgi:hypothetical protein
VRPEAWLSPLLFVLGLLLFAVAASVLLAGGDFCDSATGSSIADALGAPCGGVSALGGVLLLALAAMLLWTSRWMQRKRG